MSSETTFQKLFPLPAGSVSWNAGFWGERFDLVKDTVLPSMKKALNEPENGAVFSNFYVAAGLQEGEHKGTMWSDGDCYKWIEAMTHVYGITKDEDIVAQLNELLKVIAKAQADDGYISTPMQIRSDKQRWTSVHDHELYNMGHSLTAASVHHQITGQDNFLQIAIRLADYLYDLFQPRPVELAHFGFNPSNIMGLIDLYRVTDDDKYLELAGVFVDMRGSQPGGRDLDQTRLSLRDETQAVGHAVTAGYLYCGATDVYAETGDEKLLEAVERIWQDVTTSKMYITGGNAAVHFGASLRPELGNPHPGDAVHEAFGFYYQLPNATAYNETCANIANAMWNWRLLNLSGDAKYTDLVELVLYNSMLSSMSLDGINFCYTNPLRWYGEDHKLLSQDSYQRWYISGCYCCPTNTARTIALLHNWVYSQSDEGIWVNLYGSSSMTATLSDGEAVSLSQETNYPWDQDIKITIQDAPENEFALMFRIPGWASNAELMINGESTDQELKPGTYVEIKRNWNPGDIVGLTLPMHVKMIKAHPKAEEIRNHVAIMRGPVVYCLESQDLPDSVSVLEVFAPRDMHLTPTFEADVLGGVTVLNGVAQRIHDSEQNELLYSEVGEEVEVPIDLTLIPYYAWNNRGISEMTVWFPRKF